MKKLFLVVFSILLSGNYIFAQTIPNAGFEAWTTYNVGAVTYSFPDFWKTTDSISSSLPIGPSHSVVQETAEVNSGSSAMKLIGWTAVTTPAPGAASNGDIDASDLGNLKIIKGTPDTTRHRQLNGFYKYSPVGGDECSVIVTLVKWNSTTNSRDTIAYGEFKTSTATTGAGYSPFSVAMEYNSWTQNPDTMVILILTSPLAIGSGHVGTTLYIDDLEFVGVVGVEEVQSNINSVNIYPSPASTSMTIRVDLKKPTLLHYTIYDIRGKHVFSDVLEPYETRIDVSAFAPGNYNLFLMNGSKKEYSTNFMINR
jgi:hypothetical protein